MTTPNSNPILSPEAQEQAGWPASSLDLTQEQKDQMTPDEQVVLGKILNEVREEETKAARKGKKVKHKSLRDIRRSIWNKLGDFTAKANKGIASFSAKYEEVWLKSIAIGLGAGINLLIFSALMSLIFTGPFITALIYTAGGISVLPIIFAIAYFVAREVIKLGKRIAAMGINYATIKKQLKKTVDELRTGGNRPAADPLPT